MPLTPDQIAEIEALRATSRPTLRAVSEGAEAHLYKAHEVLDHGFIRVIDYMGNDAAIVQAARVSYGAGTKKVNDDSGLIRYLMRHWHSTPFEMCEIKLHVKLPIFVARQWIRHRTANVNEYSARYSVVADEVYLPAAEHMAAQAKSNRQGRGEVLPAAEAERLRQRLRDGAKPASADILVAPIAIRLGRSVRPCQAAKVGNRASNTARTSGVAPLPANGMPQAIVTMPSQVISASRRTPFRRSRLSSIIVKNLAGAHRLKRARRFLHMDWLAPPAARSPL